MSDTSTPIPLESSTTTKCSFPSCNEPFLAKCKRCSTDYCLNHASEVDPMMFCANCASQDDIELIEKPLVDTNGHTHQGRSLVPHGPLYKITAKLIKEMPDDELERFIEYNQRAIQEAINITDYRRIRQSLAEGEAFDRKVVKRIKDEVQPDGSIKRVVQFRVPRVAKQPKVAKPDDVVSKILAAAKGLTPEKLAEMIAAIKSKKVG